MIPFPLDYKIYTFGGRATHVQVHLDRETEHRWMLFDRDWTRVSAPTCDPNPVPPQSLAKMLDAAEKLGSGFDFVRCDFYEVAGQPLFGEMTFYPGSGLDKFAPHFTRQRFGQTLVSRKRYLRRIVNRLPRFASLSKSLYNLAKSESQSASIACVLHSPA